MWSIQHWFVYIVQAVGLLLMVPWLLYTVATRKSYHSTAQHAILIREVHIELPYLHPRISGPQSQAQAHIVDTIRTGSWVAYQDRGAKGMGSKLDQSQATLAAALDALAEGISDADMQKQLMQVKQHLASQVFIQRLHLVAGSQYQRGILINAGGRKLLTSLVITLKASVHDAQCTPFAVSSEQQHEKLIVIVV